ncbi:unnamed protein product [Chironomus riparius]|uniref:Hexosyltransferase n=1 Tax=Chironomus riparius TaxID=315576 RepID=A0A9P0IYU8_9DIPT|nr:unnamed protein product [Chironomus riparius]
MKLYNINTMDRRSIMSLLIGITLFLSTWHIMLQQQEQYYDVTLPTNNFITPSLSSQTNESAAFSNFLYDSPESLDLDNLPKNDFSQLIDLNDFKFLMNTKTCKDLNKQPLVVILIHSAPHNDNKRKTIRETWGSKDSRSLLRFFVGNVNKTSLEEKINLENEIHGDIVQGNFDDAYRNLTYKHVMVLKWFVYFCPDAKYLLKTDDDVLINTPLLYDVLDKPTPSFNQLYRSKTIFCTKAEEVRVKRTFRSKWRVSFKEYPDKYYPTFCPGYIILYTADVVPQLYHQAQKLPYFWIDDVHITGTTATKSNISIEWPGDAFLMNLDKLKENTNFLFSGPDLTENEIRSTWKLIKSNGKNLVNYSSEENNKTVPK